MGSIRQHARKFRSQAGVEPTVQLDGCANFIMIKICAKIIMMYSDITPPHLRHSRHRWNQSLFRKQNKIDSSCSCAWVATDPPKQYASLPAIPGQTNQPLLRHVLNPLAAQRGCKWLCTINGIRRVFGMPPQRRRNSPKSALKIIFVRIGRINAITITLTHQSLAFLINPVALRTINTK